MPSTPEGKGNTNEARPTGNVVFLDMCHVRVHF